MAPGQPDAEMLGAVRGVARFIASGDAAPPPTVFVEGPVTIIENFAPYIFAGEGAVARWAQGMRAHTNGLAALAHSFGPAFDYEEAGDGAYFSLPTTWRGIARGRPFTEAGGWAFVLHRQAGAWRVAAYAWAVTTFAFDQG